MSRSIQNIFGILSGYKDGKLFECRKGKAVRKAGARDEVTISEEARRMFQYQDDDGELQETEMKTTNDAGDLLHEMHGSYEI